MKKILLPLVVLILGGAVGGGAAFGTSMIVGPPPAGAAEKKADEPTSFVPTSKIIAPLVMADGRLAGYTSFEVQLEVAEEEVAGVTAKLPLLMHAINMRTYHTPMAAGPDGMLPDIGIFRKVVADASVEAFGKSVVRRVAVTQAVPA